LAGRTEKQAVSRQGTEVTIDYHLWDGIRRYILASARERAAFVAALDMSVSDEEYEQARTQMMAAKAECDRAAQRLVAMEDATPNLSPYVRELNAIRQEQTVEEAIGRPLYAPLRSVEPPEAA
jgi:hypothetical protein